jgi:phosphoesterase RecJ-like protein
MQADQTRIPIDGAIDAEFNTFLKSLAGRRLLHLGHKDADCDALGAAYAMSLVLPGALGFARGLKTTARDLARHLEIRPIIDPDPRQYDYTIIYDTLNLALLGLPLPGRYALFDHHLPGGHRYADFESELAGGAEWHWVRPLESTCSVLIELFLANGVPITRPIGVALAAGLITDTAWLQLADGAALRRLAAVLEPAGLYVQDVYAAIDDVDRRAGRRSAVIDALRSVQEKRAGRWHILRATTDTHDHGFAVLGALGRLGGDVCIVGFPKEERGMAMLELGATLAGRGVVDALQIVESIGQEVSATDAWGSPAFGRVIAPLPAGELAERCVAAVTRRLSRLPEIDIDSHAGKLGATHTASSAENA